MIPRTLETEAMDTEEEARDYDAMDFADVNALFCDDFLAFVGALAGARVLDVGTGTARIPIALAQKSSVAKVTAIDLAAHMLAVGQENVRSARLEARISLELKDAKHAGWTNGTFDAVMSNSIVHHIPEPKDALGEMVRLTKAGGFLFVRDLYRPKSEDEISRLLGSYAGDPAKLDDDGKRRYPRQRELFAASLRAALTLEEIQALAQSLGIPPARVSMSSDRHWTLAWQK
jgi:ubiquinone/menaquinone biosynthesis C-methylase UbiE